MSLKKQTKKSLTIIDPQVWKLLPWQVFLFTMAGKIEIFDFCIP
jgi:hypothetical protein